MAKFNPQHAVVPPTNFGDRNSAERFLECGKFRQCVNLMLPLIQQPSPPVHVYVPVCAESRFEKAGIAQHMPMPVVQNRRCGLVSPVTYTTVAQWAPLISCPQKCKDYRSQRWAKILYRLRPKRAQKEVPTSGVLSNGWVQGFGVASVLALAGLAVAVRTHTAVEFAELTFASTLIPTFITILVAWSRTLRDREPSRDKLNRFPERGDHDRRPQQWEALVNKFKSLTDKPIPIWGEWTYTFETGHYEWWVRHPSENTVRLCIEICKEAGRLLLAQPSFRKKFPNVAAITDDGDRWLVAIYKVAGIGKVTANSSSTTFGVVTTGEGGEIKDLPGASQVLCQMALNGI